MPRESFVDIGYHTTRGYLCGMKTLLLSTLFLIVVASSASAECYADYKAKRDDPLRLHYGVIKVPDGMCSDRSAAAKYIETQLKKSDWTLLSVLSIFGKDGLDAKKEDAGEFFLRY